jgi:hypothetical protein
MALVTSASYVAVRWWAAEIQVGVCKRASPGGALCMNELRAGSIDMGREPEAYV